MIHCLITPPGNHTSIQYQLNKLHKSMQSRVNHWHSLRESNNADSETAAVFVNLSQHDISRRWYRLQYFRIEMCACSMFTDREWWSTPHQYAILVSCAPCIQYFQRQWCEYENGHVYRSRLSVYVQMCQCVTKSEKKLLVKESLIGAITLSSI